MRAIILIFSVGLMATSALAAVDPDQDQIGIYFDSEANNNCTTASINVPFFAFIIITNPSAAEVHGLEFSYRLDVPQVFENSFFRLAQQPPCKCVDLTPEPDLLAGQYVVGLAEPLPGDGADVVFITWQFLMLAEFPIDFYLGPADPPSLNSRLPNYDIGGQLLPLGVSSGDIELPVASVNGDCRVVPNDIATFGRVKSLYR